MGSLSVVSVVCCQIGISATGRSFVHRSPRERERERDLSVSVISCNNNRVHPNWVGRAGETNEEGKKMHYKVHRTSPC